MNRFIQHVRLQHNCLLHFLQPLDGLDALFVFFKVFLLLLVRLDAWCHISKPVNHPKILLLDLGSLGIHHVQSMVDLDERVTSVKGA